MASGETNRAEAAAKRLDPSKLLFVSPNLLDTDGELRQKLLNMLRRSHDPAARADNVEYILLTMHEARAVDSARYLRDVFFPWVSLRRRTDFLRMRLGDEFARMSAFEEDTQEDVLHTAGIYRSLVCDLFDPYLTLLVASHQFVEGKFVSLDQSNLELGERSKAEYLAKRMRDTGAPAHFLAGYDPIVRNALSHTGSDGVVVEPGSVLFRNIKRQAPPQVETRRWSNDELRMKAVGLVEALWSIDAAVEIFGIDCMPLYDAEFSTLAQLVTLAFTKAQRAEVHRRNEEAFDAVRNDTSLPKEERFRKLSDVLAVQFGVRGMPWASVGIGRGDPDRFIVFTQSLNDPATDEAIIARAMALARYLVVARGVFGSMFERFTAAERDHEEKAVVVFSLPGAALTDYGDEAAGLYDLLAEAEITVRGEWIEMNVDFEALVRAEDASIGERWPRRGRP